MANVKELLKAEENGSLSFGDYSLTQKTEAADDLQITLEVEPEKEYKVYVNDTNIGKLKSSLSGKISFSIELDAGETAKVQIVK